MPDSPPQAIFLSYARDDAAAARRIAEALRSSGLEVWFDENELRGGDKWDATIRKQIYACALFVPLISQHTEAREKGYFRLEWKLAVEQTHLLAEGVPFIAPVAIDNTKENGAIVPPEFLRVQWMRLPGALPTPQFVEQTKRLLHAPRRPLVGGRGSPDPAASWRANRNGGVRRPRPPTEPPRPHRCLDWRHRRLRNCRRLLCVSPHLVPCDCGAPFHRGEIRRRPPVPEHEFGQGKRISE